MPSPLKGTHMNEISPMSRRGFMTGAAAAGAAALFTMAGCSPAAEKPASPTAEPTFDKEVDIVVAGSGTGAFAALAAADLGAESVVLLEKGDHFGGTASFSGAAFGGMYTHVLPDMGSTVTADDMFETNVHLDDWRCNREVVRALVNNSNDFQLWTEEKLGFTWGIPSALYADYQYVVAIDGEPTDMYNSASLWVTLRQYVDKHENVELLTGTPATELITDGNGAVIGVVAGSGGNAIRIRAKKGVILATGGFEFNEQMRKDNLVAPLICVAAVDTNTGDGILMGAKVGAKLSCMDRVSGAAAFLTTGQTAQEVLDSNTVVQAFLDADFDMYASMPGAIVVNARGQRFMNECAKYHARGYYMGAFDPNTGEMPNFPAYFVCDSSYFAYYMVPQQTTFGPEGVPGYFTKADTLDELAQKMGIDAEGLKAQVAAFNEAAKLGYDPQFNRGGNEYDFLTAGYYAGERPDLVNPVLGPLEQGPFYAAPYVPATLGTTGGLQINGKHQVISLDGNPIPGLYAAGNCTPSTSVGGVASGAVGGFIAVKHALGLM